MKFDYFDYNKLLELINREVEFYQKIKKSISKFERIKIFNEFYPDFIKLAEQIWGNYGGFDERVLNIVYPLIKNKKILELGCGKGHFAFMVENIVTSYCGIDIIPNNYKSKKIKFLKSNLISIPENHILEGEKFDVIYSNDFVEHIYEEDLTELFDYLIKNCLNSKSIVITITPNFDLGHFDSIDYLKFPKGKIYGSHLTLKNAQGWSKFFSRWGGKTMSYLGTYKTSHIFKHFDCFIIKPSISDFIVKRKWIRTLIRIPKACVLKTSF